MRDQIVAFPFYGGKNSHLSWLLPLLPITKRYIEPFGGSAAVLLNRERSKIEVYNDLDEEIVNFFKVLRNQPDKLIDLLRLTPYSRQEFNSCKIADNDINDLERARRFFVLIRQSFMSTKRTWATTRVIRSGWSQMITRWFKGIESLASVAERLSGVIIECRDALDVIRIYDGSNTLIYCDPSYYPEILTTSSSKTELNYAHVMDEKEHRKLLDQLRECKSQVAISGYHNDLYDSMLGDWFCYEDKIKQLAGARGKRQEILWTNYDYRSVTHPLQMILEVG